MSTSGNGSGPHTFVNTETHWWDASQVYGRDPAFASAIRAAWLGVLDAAECPPTVIGTIVANATIRIRSRRIRRL